MSKKGFRNLVRLITMKVHGDGEEPGAMEQQSDQWLVEALRPVDTLIALCERQRSDATRQVDLQISEYELDPRYGDLRLAASMRLVARGHSPLPSDAPVGDPPAVEVLAGGSLEECLGRSRVPGRR
jgi:hypothetical protein